MSITAQQIDDTPIVITTVDGKLDRDSYKDLMDTYAQFINTIGRPIYVVADFRNMESTMPDMLKIMQDARQDIPGSMNDANLKMLLFVGATPLVRMFRDTMQSRGSKIGMAIFDNIEDAIKTAQVQLSIENPTV